MKLFIFSSLVAMVTICQGTFAEDSISIGKPTEQLTIKKNHFWRQLMPNHIIGQNAGNMGALSLGIGWNYGKSKIWETDFLVGFVPKGMSGSARATMTLKQDFLPWRLNLGKGFSVEPLYLGLYVNAIIGSEFWNHQPSRYPNNYYWFSTRFRTNVCVGQRVSLSTDFLNVKSIKSFSFFYEVGSCDLYIIEYMTNKHISFWNVAGLSLGFMLQLR